MKKISRLFGVVVICLFSSFLTYANAGVEEKDTSSVKFSGYVQFWLRYSELNPGSSVSGAEVATIADLSLRRYRLNVSKSVGKNGNFSLVLGNNDLSSNRPNAQFVELLDAYYVHKLNDQILFGIGKLGTQGPLRYSAPPASTNLIQDIPIYQLLTLNKWDQKSRKLSIYTDVRIGDVKAMISLSKPILSSDLTRSAEYEFSRNQSSFIYAGYFNYYFLGSENSLSPYPKGTYLGEKDVVVLGLGFQSAPNAMEIDQEGSVSFSDLRALGVDVFVEKRLNQDEVVTAYIAFLDTKYGDTYLRQLGVNNPISEGIGNMTTFSKPGNSVPVIGTGSTYYYQLGFLKKSWIRKMDFQFFQTTQHSVFERYSTPVTIYSAGVNFLLNGHKSKITASVENRPVFGALVADELDVIDRKNTFIVQYQLKF